MQDLSAGKSSVTREGVIIPDFIEAGAAQDEAC
jgi:hypothetical protein